MEAIHPVVQFVRTEMRSQQRSFDLPTDLPADLPKDSPPQALALSVPQFRALAFLSRQPNSSLSDVAEHLGVTRATASTLIDRLVQRGLIHRAALPQERRQITLKLTETGNHHLQQTRSATRSKVAELLSRLTTDELATVSSGMVILQQLFREHTMP